MINMPRRAIRYRSAAHRGGAEREPASPQPVNTPITLTATPTGGGGQVQYLFRAGYSDAAGWHWTNINGTYTTSATCTWTPTAAEPTRWSSGRVSSGIPRITINIRR